MHIIRATLMIKRHVRRLGPEIEERTRRRANQIMLFHHQMLYGEATMNAKELVVATIKGWQKNASEIGELLDGVERLIFVQNYMRDFQECVRVKHQYVVGLWDIAQRELNEAEQLRIIPSL